jgi:hypothetical protein
MDKTGLRVLPGFVVVCGEFPVISVFVLVSMGLSSVRGSGSVDFFGCKNVDETWCVVCFLWQFGVPKTWLRKIRGREADFSTPPFTM